MKTFSSAQPAQGMNYKRGALIAGGLAIAAYYIAERRNHAMPPNASITDATLNPESGTTMQLGTNREQQQSRAPPPSKKTVQTDMGRN
ncbi:hypothetical protein Gpo141_00012167 [Globisporangium polare]